jgi:hypothetical protein
MSRSTGFMILLLGSVILGIAAGEWFYRAVAPPTDQGAPFHMGFLLHGALVGLAIFLWTLVAILLQKLWRKPSHTEEAPRTPQPPPAL